MDSKDKTKSKQYYTVKIEVTAPVNLTYRIYAENAEQALDIVLKNSLQNLSSTPQPILSRMKKIKASVYTAGSSIIQLVKNLG